MKFLPALLATSLFAATAASAQTLLITEMNSNGTPADFWELTNYGSTSIDLSGWTWDDDSANRADAAAVTVANGTTLAAGSSILFTIATTELVFRNAWTQLAPTTQVIAGGPGLGQNDAINLFGSTGTSPILTLSYAASGFTRTGGLASAGGHAGVSAGGSSNQSLVWDVISGTSAPRYTFADGVTLNTYTASGGTAVGSPGFSGVSAVPEPSTYAAIAGVLVLGFAAYRRRQS